MTAGNSAAYASALAQVIPVLLLSAVAVGLRLPLSGRGRLRGLVDLSLIATIVGVAFTAEVVALFGVRQGGLSDADVLVLNWLLVALGFASVFRLLLPHVEAYVSVAQIPEARVWRILLGIAFGTFVACTLVAAGVER